MRKVVYITQILILFFVPVFAQDDCYELIWNDEFNYSGLPDSTKWSHEVGGGGWGNNELQYYTNKRLENSRVEEGNLIIEARKENYEGKNYTSARLITYHNNHSWKYGKIEARIKLPYGQGIWPAFWMLGDKIFEGTNWPACGEIDILEMIGGGDGRDNTLHGTIHWADANNNHATYGDSKTLSEGIFADDYHVFSIEWDETSIKWFLDSVQFHEADITPGHLSEFHDDFFIILNMAVGGDWPGSPNSSTVFPQKMYIDYVRVFKKNEAPKISGANEVVKSEQDINFTTVESEDFIYNWNVPEGTTITKGQGTHAISVDWGCEPDTVFCELTSLCDTHQLFFPVAIKELEIEGKETVSMGEELMLSVPILVNTTYSWEYSLNDTISFSDTNLIKINWGDVDGFVKLKYENACGIDSVSKEVVIVRQLPYPDENTPNQIPGTIEATNYDTGGEGIAYHDVDTQNQGNGPRQNEAVDTETYGTETNIGWVSPGEWYEYTIEVEKDTTYYLEAQVASLNVGGNFRILVNGEDRTGINVPNTSSWSTFKSVYVDDIQFLTTDTVIRIYIDNGEFNIRRLIFSSTSFTSISGNEKLAKNIKIYPTYVTNELLIDNAPVISEYKILDINGRIFKEGFLDSGSINVSDLKKGFYLLIIKDRANSWTNKFMKI